MRKTSFFWVAIIWTAFAYPAKAVPSFAQKYKTSCATCHTVAPALNRFGLAFQANYFRWPGEAPAVQKALPLSVFVTGSQEKGQGQRTTSALRSVQLNVADAGYFVALAPVGTEEAKQGSIRSAYLAIPTGQTGLQVVVGQTSPLMFQYDPVNALTRVLPQSLTGPIHGFSPVDFQPTVRGDYFRQRGSSSPDGDYLSVGVPFNGALSLRSDAKVGSANGVYAHAFRRKETNRYGVLGYIRGSASLFSLLGTHQFTDQTRLLLIGTTGSGPGERLRTASAEVEHIALPGLALTGRVEWGAFSPFPVAAVTYSPPHLEIFRFSVEYSGQRGQQRTSLIARLQL